ncbi:glycerol-3-phosphate acyltransferase [Acidihalobacter yilgarnensis]|uniref:Glycerol-3-phosphate acyltransferase n=1 Tax=Acidihalobacter yilgarnensis TaxID=2819280 RepID=A0A1D8IJY9_9GAMM|nr:glycerol-3-phosphate 1-O-acyltransferase PlsY [Acidihalobacter yilgarnensis]AOU96776.1 glycerol-3-phosphate acyltransferase [Acidihalobacter yilgarnensis]
MPYDVLLIIAGYLLGSLSTAILTCRLMGLPDPRGVGSGNPGATNVLRAGGKGAAIITLAGDLFKGTLPVLAALMLHRGETAAGLVGLAAFLGHLYPVYFGFKGGKGVATALGVVFGLNPLAGIAVSATWLGMALVSRISSLSALTAFLLAPAYLYLLTHSASISLTMMLMSALIFWRHRRNIRNLTIGAEPRIGRKAGG